VDQSSFLLIFDTLGALFLFIFCRSVWYIITFVHIVGMNVGQCAFQESCRCQFMAELDKKGQNVFMDWS